MSDRVAPWSDQAIWFAGLFLVVGGAVGYWLRGALDAPGRYQMSTILERLPCMTDTSEGVYWVFTPQGWVRHDPKAEALVSAADRQTKAEEQTAPATPK